MKYTLLNMTQDILSSMSADEVNSISDTSESLQVANIIKQKYFDLINRVPLPEHEQMVQLNPSLDSTAPVLMYIPDGIADLKWLKYFNSNVLNVSSPTTHGVNTNIVSGWSTTSITSNTISTGNKTFTVGASLSITAGNTATATATTGNSMSGTVISYSGTALVLNITSTTGSGTFTNWTITQFANQNAVPGYQYVTILPTSQFVDMVNGFNPQDTNVATFTFADNSNHFNSNYRFYYKNDRQPCYCTIISNYYVIFDSYDRTQDSTLQGSKSMGWGRVIPAWSNTDSFTPNLAEEQFQLLLNEAKALAFFELKQQPHQLAMQESKRGWSNVQKNKAIANRPSYFDELPNHGRSNITGYGGAPRYFKQMGFDR